jgi:hypothetical protein
MVTSKVDGERYGSAEVDLPKSEIMHIEADMSSRSEENLTVLPPVKQLTFIECLKTYRYASLFCFLAAVGALSDGYQVQMSGSIVALQGFIHTFGKPNAAGKYIIDPQHLALWGGKYIPFYHRAGAGTNHQNQKCC